MGALAQLLRSRALMRALLSFGAAFTAEWAFTVAISLVAFADGGALAVGLVSLLRLVPAALLAPVISAYADRVPRERVLAISSIVRGTATLGAAAVLAVDGSRPLLYGLAVVSTIAFTPYRASHSALLPSLCRTPDELTLANVARGALDSLSVITGSFVAAALVALADVAAALAFAGVSALVSALLLVRLRYERATPAADGRRGLVREVREGLTALTTHAGLADVVGLVVLQAAIRGAFTVFVVVVAIDILGGPESDVGLLMGSLGVGALAGSIACAALIGSRAMARWLGIAIVLWGAPLAVMGMLEIRPVAILAAATIGVGNALVDVTAFTLIARMAPDAVMARVFGLLESLGALAVGLGAVIAPLVIAALGASHALIAVGSITPVVCLLCWSRLRAIDRSVAVRSDAISLLRQVPMFRPLPVPVVEHLAAVLTTREVQTDEWVLAAGDVGNCYYLVESGAVQVLDGDRVVRTLGPGDGFGEIALLQDTPRTMSVQAIRPTSLRCVDRSEFLAAVTSISGARSQAFDTMRSYIPPGR